MLATPEVIAVVVGRLEHHGVVNLVVDPVMVAKSGDRLLTESAVVTLREALLPLALVLTPNLPEARVLLGVEAHASIDALDAARRLCALGPRVAVVKGGHAEGDEVVDVVHDALHDETAMLRYPRIPGHLDARDRLHAERGDRGLPGPRSRAAHRRRERAGVPSGRPGARPRHRRGHGPLGHLDQANAAPVVKVPTKSRTPPHNG